MCINDCPLQSDVWAPLCKTRGYKASSTQKLTSGLCHCCGTLVGGPGTAGGLRLRKGSLLAELLEIVSTSPRKLLSYPQIDSLKLLYRWSIGNVKRGEKWHKALLCSQMLGKLSHAGAKRNHRCHRGKVSVPLPSSQRGASSHSPASMTPKKQGLLPWERTTALWGPPTSHFTELCHAREQRFAHSPKIRLPEQ